MLINLPKAIVILITVDSCACLARAAGDGEVGPDLLLQRTVTSCIAPYQGNRTFGETYLGNHFTTDICFPGARAFGDIDGDGRLDMVDEEGVFLGHDDGRFGAWTVAFTNAIGAVAFATADLNKDGRDDVVIGTDKLRVYFGNPDGTLETLEGEINIWPPFEASGGYGHLRLVDLDQDGHEDLVGSSENGPVLAFGKGNGGFDQYTKGAKFLHEATVIDLNQDGLLDIVTVGDVDWLSPAIIIYRTLGKGELSDEQVIPIVSIMGQEFHSLTVTVGDANHDGILDLLAASLPGKLAAFFGKGDGGFEPEVLVDLPVQDFATALLVYDIDRDGLEDLVVGYLNNWTQVFWQADLSSSPTEIRARTLIRISVAPPLRRRFVRGDLNNDRTLNLSDPVRILEQLFAGAPIDCGDASDADDSSRVDIADAVYLLRFLFQGGNPPPYPYPTVGGDLTVDLDLTRPLNEGQGTGGDLGCSYETFFYGETWCTPEQDPATCFVPIKQWIDIGF